MENKNIYDKHKIEITDFDCLKKYEPNNDYILVLGTSHSCGVCVIEREDKQFLDRQEDVWCYQVADALGLEVFNISVGGQTSLNMMAQFNDYFEYFDKSKCKLVIAEVRQHEGSEVFANDLIRDFSEESHEIKYMTPAIALGRDIRGGSSLVDDALLNRFVLDFNGEGYATKMAKSVTDNPSKYAIEQLNQLMETYTTVIATTSRDYIRDLVYIQTLISLAKANQLPFYWFGWDNSFNDPDNKTYVDKGFDRVTRVFNHRFKEIPVSATQSFIDAYGHAKMESIKCDCGHHKEPLHDLVAKIIIKELKENGH